ncbi:MAG: YgfZ/GcvT domain-containing protein [Rhodoblastus sp.]
MPAVLLAERAIVSVSGQDARAFLQGLVTCDMAAIAPGAPGFGALLTPQGKILFDFLIVQDGGRFLFDVAREKAGDFVKRLSMYKLRAKIEIADLSAAASGDCALAIVALSGDGAGASENAIAFTDPRAPELGLRAILPFGEARKIADGNREAYEARRIAAGVPQGGLDFAYGDAFPHEANMDLLHGVSFDKGCYVGQEVVSRMQHRGLVRKRVVRVHVEGKAAPGAEIRAGDIAVGVLGGSQGVEGLAIVRLDRAEDARGQAMLAGGARISLL